MKNNEMRKIKLKEIVLNCGATKEKLEKSIKLLKLIGNSEPKKTKSNKRIPGFNVSPGLEVGCKVTIGGERAKEILKRLLEAVNFELDERKFGNGTVTFGVEEYLVVPGLQFHREIGILGFDVAVKLTRAGLTISEKKIKRGKIPLRQRITKNETIMFMKENFNIKIKERRKKKESI